MQPNELLVDKEITLKGILGEQHPIIHTWLVLSSLSICFMSAFFFIFQ